MQASAPQRRPARQTRPLAPRVPAPAPLEPRQRQLLRTLWEAGPLSRWELHQRLGLTPNGVGALADQLLQRHILRPRRPQPPAGGRAGRPRIPLEIDPAARQVLGLAIGRGGVEVQRLSLTGAPIGPLVAHPVTNPAPRLPPAARLLAQCVDPQALAIGITVPGFVDPAAAAILFSSALPGRPSTSLAPVYTAAAGLPVVLENDMHAIAARWLLHNRPGRCQDVLLVRVADGQLGAALLVEGHPNRGCAAGGNELGHTRFPNVPTPRCYCGQSGCLERLVSTDWLRQEDPASAPLADRLAAYHPGRDALLETLIGYLAHGLANAINFIRPHRLVLVSPFVGHQPFIEALTQRMRSLILVELADRVSLDLWDEPPVGSAQTAAWLALADLLLGHWSDPAPTLCPQPTPTRPD
jgi:predicted NBD/HSP70 family sugar kinase